jgi:predicted ATPase
LRQGSQQQQQLQQWQQQHTHTLQQHLQQRGGHNDVLYGGYFLSGDNLKESLAEESLLLERDIFFLFCLII